MTRTPDPRSTTSIGMEWGTRITTIGLEFAVPALLGHGLDRWLGTSPWFTVVGAVLGMAIGMLRVLRLPEEIRRTEASRSSARSDQVPNRNNNDSTDDGTR